MYHSCFLLAVLLTASAALPIEGENLVSNDRQSEPDTFDLSSASCSSAVSASSVVDADLDSVQPSVNNCGGLLCSFYLTSSSCLGANGPIGAWGPLGALGPLGVNTWNPSVYMSGIGNWQDWASSIQADSSNPLSSQGPLSPTAYGQTLPSINDFGKQLQAHGLWTVLGPLGPLGALGPLGPLGPMGYHGYAQDSNGNYLNKQKQIVRTLSAAWDASSSKTWPLVEMYPSFSAANSVANQDTSFMCLDGIGMGGSRRFTVKSSETQFVTIVVVPENVYDSFTLSVTDSNGKVLASSTETLFINWVQVLTPRPTTLKINVKFNLSGRGIWPVYTYRLIVVGSTSMFSTEDISGQHVLSC